MEEKIKHLEFVQNTIARMSTNSFQIKGWMITIVTALLALFASSSKELYVFVAIVPTIVFWCLDSYYLQQERKFRGLYDEIATLSITNFDMSIEKYHYDKKDEMSIKYCYWEVFFSKTLLSFYGIIVLGLLVGAMLLYVNRYNCL